jgi:hypothetical protein
MVNSTSKPVKTFDMGSPLEVLQNSASAANFIAGSQPTFKPPAQSVASHEVPATVVRDRSHEQERTKAILTRLPESVIDRIEVVFAKSTTKSKQALIAGWIMQGLSDLESKLSQN